MPLERSDDLMITERTMERTFLLQLQGCDLDRTPPPLPAHEEHLL